ncbi:MAG TPA: NADH-quinone oxidoreductase subunit J [Puia sp.]|jgi:NADH-quinone oxidoreductase subunit J|nr:NADH-quinone oxidoreductase subunit J [Puia sp.]
MSASAVVFYILSVLILASALLAVTSGKIFRSAIWLLFSLTGIAGLYFWLGMDFVAAVQIIVYVGGIVVLIIFSIFLTQQSGKDLPAPVRARVLYSALAACLGFLLTCVLLRQFPFRQALIPDYDFAPDMSVRNIGIQLLSTKEHGYVLPFEVISLLLLAAMIGCIVLAIKTKPGDR